MLRVMALALICFIGMTTLQGSEPEYEFIGSHFVASYYGCDEEILNDKEKLLTALTQAVGGSGATLLKIADYQFEPKGVTIVALLSESHASIHTYPEYQACFVDFFTCGLNCDYKEFDVALKTALRSTSSNSQHLIRN